MSGAPSFYTDTPALDRLRLGDVIRGFAFASPQIEKPSPTPLTRYSIDLDYPDFQVVLTPCCSVGNGVLSLCPLIHINPRMLIVPHAVDDLSRLNRRMTFDQAVPAEQQKALEKEGVLARRRADWSLEGDYAWKEWFIYAPNTILPSYSPVHGSADTSYHAVDFRQVHHVACRQVSSPESVPTGIKFLELSIASRNDLRGKIVNYYGRVPVEDSALL